MEKVEEEVLEKEVLTIEEMLNTLDYNQIFRAKGFQGLYTLRSKVNKSGMIGIQGFLDKSIRYNKTVKALDLECLGTQFVETFIPVKDEKDGTVEPSKLILPFNQLMQNIHSKVNITKDAKATIEMEDIAPFHDKDTFKNYHAAKLLSWYLIIVDKVGEVV